MAQLSIGEPLTSLLLPGTGTPGLDDLSFSTFVDGGVSVPVSPVDQLLVAFCRRAVRELPQGVVPVVQLPRARHRIALTLSICLHLLRMKERLHSGPVVLAALDVDMPEQLRKLSMRNYGRINLGRGNPLSAQRLTRVGDLAPLVGSTPASTNSSLVYFNTRVGSPRLRCGPPLVVVDATSITNPNSRARVLAWASDHSAVTTIIVGDIGDEYLAQTVRTAGHRPIVLPVTEEEVTALVYELNREQPALSPLSSMWMLWRQETAPLSIQQAGDAELNAAIARAFACLASRPDGPMPMVLDYPTKLLRAGTRLAATVYDYRTACALADQPGEGPAPLRARLRRLEFRESGPWHAWGVARWGELKIAVETLWRQLDECNPKVTRLWDALDHADRTGAGQILIRCHSKAAAAATRASLEGEGRSIPQRALWDKISAGVEVTTFATRYPPGHADLQILTGNPPPWHFSLLLGAEASANWLLAYDAENAAFRRQMSRWHTDTDESRRGTFRAMGAAMPAPVVGPAFEAADDVDDPPELCLPGLSLVEVLDRATATMDSPSTGTAPSGWRGSGTNCDCVPVRLDDGRTWWIPNEKDDDGDLATPVLVVTAGGQSYRPLRELSSGEVIIVAAGDGTESIHARLVAVTHTNDEVASLDVILDQFRRAARSVLHDKPTRQAAISAVRDAGAQAPGQLVHWASGRTIAPQSPSDIAAVFRAAQQPIPDLQLLNSVAGTLRTLHRSLGRFVAALASDRADDAVEELRRLIGDSAEELLDEFVPATVTEIGSLTATPANLAGRLQ
ncbi:hypothetical protein NONI108955_05815 [Nocardia ninae]|uniref:DISARM protein DrmE C-terminal domain-containing protein n=1 Tax=Nocardia ninae NBRC 108245 TaxID=1210091 RepID=A0A511MDY7_9NOCA|nr:hypothetical protein [Nocardia ninae]GEM38842.1 hypothetical protein NN4_33610 [Nocardia ninae NBRC 108245]